MKLRDAELALEDAEIVPVFFAPIEEAKRVQQRCLDADLPVVLARLDEPGRKGAPPRLQLLARESDAAKINALHEAECAELALREGTVRKFEVKPIPAEDPEGEPPCPACGCTQPLVDGACAECGLTLA